jgi:hypothetical protein
MRSPIFLMLIGLAGASIGLAAGPAPARANCYELFGCTNSDYYKVAQLKQASCQILWEMRNQIYKENALLLPHAAGNSGLRQCGV